MRVTYGDVPLIDLHYVPDLPYAPTFEERDPLGTGTTTIHVITTLGGPT